MHSFRNPQKRWFRGLIGRAYTGFHYKGNHGHRSPWSAARPYYKHNFSDPKSTYNNVPKCLNRAPKAIALVPTLLWICLPAGSHVSLDLCGNLSMQLPADKFSYSGSPQELVCCVTGLTNLETSRFLGSGCVAMSLPVYLQLWSPLSKLSHRRKRGTARFLQ